MGIPHSCSIDFHHKYRYLLLCELRWSSLIILTHVDRLHNRQRQYSLVYIIITSSIKGPVEAIIYIQFTWASWRISTLHDQTNRKWINTIIYIYIFINSARLFPQKLYGDRHLKFVLLLEQLEETITQIFHINNTAIENSKFFCNRRTFWDIWFLIQRQPHKLNLRFFRIKKNIPHIF